MIDPRHAIIRNGALLIIPFLAISFGLWNYLPEVYSSKVFSSEIPIWITLPENIFRILIFAVPFFLFFGNKEVKQKQGWYLYTFGVALYFFSYLVQILYPTSNWSTSYLGFSAPAWTTLFWLYGIGLICSQSWLFSSWNRTIYFVLATLFVLLHMLHTTLVYLRINN